MNGDVPPRLLPFLEATTLSARVDALAELIRWTRAADRSRRLEALLDLLDVTSPRDFLLPPRAGLSADSRR